MRADSRGSSRGNARPWALVLGLHEARACK